MSEQIDLDAVEREWDGYKGSEPYLRDTRGYALLQKVPDLLAHARGLREQVRELGSPFCMDTGEPATDRGECPRDGGDACLVMPKGAAKEIARLNKDLGELPDERERLGIKAMLLEQERDQLRERVEQLQQTVDGYALGHDKQIAREDALRERVGEYEKYIDEYAHADCDYEEAEFADDADAAEDALERRITAWSRILAVRSQAHRAHPADAGKPQGD